MNNIIKKIKEISLSSVTKKVLITIGIIAVILFIFQAGMFFGFKKASFSFRTGERYFKEMRNVGGPMMGIQRDDFSNAHGAIGQIVSINLPTLVVEDRDNFTKTISISTTTIIRSMKEDIKTEDLKVNDFVVIFGEAKDNAVVEARLIRVMPEPETMMNNISSGRRKI